MDVREVYTFSNEQKPIDGPAIGVYTYFCSAVAHFLRLANVYGMISIHEVWAHGATFKAICFMDLCKGILNYTDTMVSCSTVLTKAIHMKKLHYFGKQYY